MQARSPALHARSGGFQFLIVRFIERFTVLEFAAFFHLVIGDMQRLDIAHVDGGDIMERIARRFIFAGRQCLTTLL